MKNQSRSRSMQWLAASLASLLILGRIAATPARGADPLRPLLVVDVTGPATVQHDTRTPPQDVSVGMEIQPGDRIRALDDIYLVLFYDPAGNSKVHIDKGSTFTVTSTPPAIIQAGYFESVRKSVVGLFTSREAAADLGSGSVQTGGELTRVPEADGGQDSQSSPGQDHRREERAAATPKRLKLEARGSAAPLPQTIDAVAVENQKREIARPSSNELDGAGTGALPVPGSATAGEQTADRLDGQPAVAAAPPPQPQIARAAPIGNTLSEVDRVPALWNDRWDLDHPLARAHLVGTMPSPLDGSAPEKFTAALSESKAGTPWQGGVLRTDVTYSLLVSDGSGRTTTLSLRALAPAIWDTEVPRIRQICDGGTTGKLLAARELARRGLIVASYIVYRQCLEELTNLKRPTISLKWLAAKVGELAAVLGDGATLKRTRSMVGQAR